MKKTVYVGLGNVSCDNLALNGIFGFIECFSADYYCTMCTTTNTEAQEGVCKLDFTLRFADIYNADVEALTTLAPGTNSHGVKAPCCLKNIEGLHVTQNFLVDSMHTLLEGVVPYELGCILYCLVNEKH